MAVVVREEVESKLTTRRVDKEQSFEDKVPAVNKILAEGDQIGATWNS